jgi:hypothetical protein
MDTKRIRNRLERVEKQAGIAEECRVLPPLIFITFAEGYALPNVFDRPLEEWELYKRSMTQHTGGRVGPVILVDPFAEYRIRTGRNETPREDRVPAEAYSKWMDSDRLRRLECQEARGRYDAGRS